MEQYEYLKSRLARWESIMIHIWWKYSHHNAWETITQATCCHKHSTLPELAPQIDIWWRQSIKHDKNSLIRSIDLFCHRCIEERNQIAVWSQRRWNNNPWLQQAQECVNKPKPRESAHNVSALLNIRNKWWQVTWCSGCTFENFQMTDIPVARLLQAHLALSRHCPDLSQAWTDSQSSVWLQPHSVWCTGHRAKTH